MDVYDIQYGYLSWTFDSFLIKELNISFPRVFYLTRKGFVGCLDFETGKALWKNTSITFYDLYNEGCENNSETYDTFRNNILKFIFKIIFFKFNFFSQFNNCIL